VDHLLFGGDQKDLHLTAGVLRRDDVVVDLDVVLGQADVVVDQKRELVFELGLGHGRQNDLLDDDRVPGDGDRYVFLAQPQSPPQVADRVDDGRLVHNRAVDDGLRHEPDHVEGLELIASLAPLELDSLDAV
jgi:hypothetical protein